MGTKTKKGKTRLDKFYKIAKETGYRSRASFKLIQLNRKYHFLEKCQILIDLCAAPGGWLQVAEKYMPMNTIKIGIDLDPIKPIPNCKTFQCDITTPKCIQLIRKEIKNQKADAVINDGAPNVGANWSKDAYGQVELVLASLKLASQVLKRGGWFVTKVFRSQDFNSLIWVLNKFFEKVEVTKPEASRNTSAEIFVVGIGYKSPEFIDEKFFQSDFIFKDTQQQQDEQPIENEINSLDKLFAKRRNRGGYDDDAPQHLHTKISFENFIRSENPFAVFYQYNQIVFSQQEKDKYFGMTKQADDWEHNCSDLKVLGKREVQSLIKWRDRIKHIEFEKAKAEKKQSQKIKFKEEHDTDSELEKEIEKGKKLETKQSKRENDKRILQLTKSALGLENFDHGDMEEDQELFNFNKFKNIEDLEYVDLEDIEKVAQEEMEALKPLRNRHQYKKIDKGEVEENLEIMYQQKKARREIAKEKEKANQLTKKRKKYRDEDGNLQEEKFECELIEEEEERQKKLKKEQDSAITAQVRQKQLNPEEQAKIQGSLNKKWFDQDIFKGLQNDLTNDIYFGNPMNKSDSSNSSDYDDSDEEPAPRKKQQKEQTHFDDDDEWSDDGGKYDLKLPQSDMEKRRKLLARQRQRQEIKDKKSEKNKIEYVKEKQLEDYDIDDLAENLALAKKMLGKRNRQQILDSTYSRYANNDDEEDLPDWFVEDEKLHNQVNLPITKEEVQAERERLYAINQRLPKKVIEAKWRNKNKIIRKMKKAKQKSEQIYNEEGVDERTKMKQIQRVYKKELADKTKKKEIVVGRKFKATSAGRNSRTHALVDSRLKKDMKAKKRAEQRNMGKRKSKRMNRKRK